MEVKQSSRRTKGKGAAPRRRQLSQDIKLSLRDMSIQLSLLNHRVGVRLGLQDIDLDCLDLIDRHGPLSPSALARRSGLHPATVTGILDRLERGGWVARERDPEDRRAVVLRTLRDRTTELIRLYAGMNKSLDQLCAGYDEAQLEVIAEFLRRTGAAGQTAGEALTAAPTSTP